MRAPPIEAAKSPTALISYSHDSPEHEQRVLDLCNRLRERGVDAFIDRFLPGAPSEGWPLWMERQIESRDFTLMVCSETYRRRFMEDEPSGVGRGVVWEARILRNLLYEDSEWHGRIVPVLLEPDARPYVPVVFRGHFYDLVADGGFESLLRHLLREPGAAAAALGALGPQGSRWSAFERPWLVPDAARTRYFTGREQLLELLRSQLLERHRAALSGLGGVGKTQAALEYATRHRAEYPDGVFWIDAETMGGLTGGFVEIAKTLRLAAAASNDQEQVVRAVLEWLNGTDRWLLILDNVEGREVVQTFLPQRGEGHVLLTSRESVFQEIGIARGLEVVDLDGDEALRFLRTRTGRNDLGDQERSAAAALAAELGHLPLALEQAAAYLAETGAAFADYLASFRKRRLALLERSKGHVSRDTVAVTWAANFEAVERASPAAADVLRISAFLAPDAIPFETFLKGAQALGGAIADALPDPEDPLAMAELLRPLARYSLVRSDAQSHAYGVHRLVGEIVRGSLAEPDCRMWVEHAAVALNAAFPELEYATWAQCDRLVAHVTTIAQWLGQLDVQLEDAARVLQETGRYLNRRSRYAEAQPLLERSLAIRERALGPDHPDVARSLHDLAAIYREQARYAEAEPLHERALAIRERAFGPDHAEVAASLHNLATVYLNQGRYDEAERLNRRALAIRERAFGPDHLLVAETLNNLGVIQQYERRPAEAQKFQERALAIRERSLGPDHPELATSLYNLALSYVAQRLYDEAEPRHERALAIWERALGPDHPLVASCLQNLAEIHWHRGRLAQAETLQKRALATWERTLGPDHPDAAWSLNSLAEIYREQGRYAEAEPLCERALAIRERALGSDHLFVAESLAGLARLRKAQGRYAEAAPLFERALAIGEFKLDAGHPDIAEIRADLDAVRAALSRAT
jgi:tetratricopeptide (TPR) repeat protein